MFEQMRMRSVKLSYFTAVSSGTSRDKVSVPDVSSHSCGLTQCRPSVTWNTHNIYRWCFHVLQVRTTTLDRIQSSHPVCLPCYHQQPLPRFGLPWLQGGLYRCYGGGDGGWLLRLSGSYGRGGDRGRQFGSRGGGGFPVCSGQFQ